MRWRLKNGVEVLHNDNRYRLKPERKAPSKIAQTFKDFIKKHASHYIWYEEYRLPRTRLRVDFLTPNKLLSFEVSGEQHFEYVEHFFKNRPAFGRQIKRDLAKIEYLERNGYKVIELDTEDIKNLSLGFFREKYNIYF